MPPHTASPRIKMNIRFSYLLFGVILTYFSSYLPDLSGVVGIEGTRISSLVAFGSLNGMLFGPFWGAIVSGTGMFLHELNTPGYISKNAFSMLSLFFIMLCSVVSGLIVQRQHRMAALIYGFLLFLWYSTDVGREAYYYPWFHIITLIAFLVVGKYVVESIHSKTFIFIYLFFAALLGVLSDHIAGSIAYSYIYDLPASAFSSVVLLYPMERAILALSATLIAFFILAIYRDLILSSDNFKEDVDRLKSQELEEYLNRDVMQIIENEGYER
ncbi:MAG: hypothetical protein Q8J68_10140 [Methanolobus sp.]|uniref:hypothetical protein n=1 Tax=Methanolobus sp. TaxID=1874737 RepID=UPI00273076C7|nr:hypothetical protein [Methanolobus sp.]MDP2217632.1 hypothetical protein [Methanolobus sp.]